MADNSLAKEFNRNRMKITRESDRFKRIFNLNLKQFYGDNALTIMFGFDIIAFSDIISERHCNSGNWAKVDSPFNLMEIVQLEYGNEGKALINFLIGV